MEIYKDLNTKATKDFEQLLNSQLSKIKIEEGKIISGVVTKITNKYQQKQAIIRFWGAG